MNDIEDWAFHTLEYVEDCIADECGAIITEPENLAYILADWLDSKRVVIGSKTYVAEEPKIKTISEHDGEVTIGGFYEKKEA